MYVQPTIEPLGNWPIHEIGGAFILALGSVPVAAPGVVAQAAAWVA